MTKVKIGILAAIVVTGIGTFAVAQQMDHKGMKSGHMSSMMDDMMAKPGDSASTKAFKETHMKMMHGMMITYSGNPDVDFVRGMIPHHQGAIDMAKVHLANGKDPAMRKLAESIIADQEKEIAVMNDWLKKNDK